MADSHRAIAQCGRDQTGSDADRACMGSIRIQSGSNAHSFGCSVDRP